MKVSELSRELDGLDPDAEVVVRVQLDPSHDGPAEEELEASDVLGEYAVLSDERSVSVEFGRVTLVGDLRLEQ